jgi:hypothetical protein
MDRLNRGVCVEDFETLRESFCVRLNRLQNTFISPVERTKALLVQPPLKERKENPMC